jgi:hypothetical protein
VICSVGKLLGCHHNQYVTCICVNKVQSNSLSVQNSFVNNYCSEGFCKLKIGQQFQFEI